MFTIFTKKIRFHLESGNPGFNEKFDTNQPPLNYPIPDPIIFIENRVPEALTAPSCVSNRKTHKLVAEELTKKIFFLRFEATFSHQWAEVSKDVKIDPKSF